ncbi:hypothetical protein [Aporhodopirellula aestuarii]|uniref:MotA/TolQ/ExbB proton channel domain-containing protein n=1 Tax=Aporhodopirellula aestuarii TaxID=2950107 RepID=A0ABT0UC47_9BACT|nr:hypothetical protein [Aporhodopirellula aestuarii]MCM2374444.1 hypothetical protein [Aporhodopirellula aestuarii]
MRKQAPGLAHSWEGQLSLLVAILFLQLLAVWAPLLTLATIFPLAILGTSTQSSASNGTRASRFYLTCLLIAGTSLLGEMRELSQLLATSSEDEVTNPLTILAGVLPGLSLRVAVPFSAGLVGLIVFGQIDAETRDSEDARVSKSWLAEMQIFMQKSDAPKQVVDYLDKLAKRVKTVSNNYDKLARAANSSESAMKEVADVCHSLNSQMKSLYQELEKGQHEMANTRSEISGVAAELGQLQTQVDEMGVVLDQFAEIAEHQVMQYRPHQEQRV